MNILASDVKRVLKRLNPLKAETYQIGENGLSAQDPSEVWVVCASSLSELAELHPLRQTFSFSGKKFSQVISRMSGELDITTEENKLIIKSYKAKVELETRAVSKPVPPAPAEKYATLKLADLKWALTVAAASASPKKSEAFGGVVLIQNLPLPLDEDTPKGYRVVGTDGMLLTVVRRDLPVPFEFKFPLNLTAAAIVQLMDEDTVEIGETNTHLVLKSGSDVVYAAKPTKAYPDFEKLILAKHPVTLQVPTDKWLNALRTVETLIEEEKDNGFISLHFKDGVVQFSTIGIGSTASDEAEYEQTDPDPVFDPKEFKMKVKAKYLSGFLAKSGGTATISVSSTKSITYESGQVMAITTPTA